MAVSIQQMKDAIILLLTYKSQTTLKNLVQ